MLVHKQNALNNTALSIPSPTTTQYNTISTSRSPLMRYRICERPLCEQCSLSKL